MASPPRVIIGGKVTRVGRRRGGGGGGGVGVGLGELAHRLRRWPPPFFTSPTLFHLNLVTRVRWFAMVVVTLLIAILTLSPHGHGCSGRDDRRRPRLVVVAFSAGGGVARRAGAGGGFGGGRSGGKRGNKKRRKRDGRGGDDASGRDGRRRGGGGFGGGTGNVDDVERRTIQLGGERDVDVYVPPDRMELELEMEVESSSDSSLGPSKTPRTREELLETYRSFYGTGDVLWPSSLRLSSLLANCPSFADGRDVFEIGCGLGLCSASITKYNHPRSITLSDVDGEVLDLAFRTCEEILAERWKTESSEIEVGAMMATTTRVDRCQMDWYDESTWPSGKRGGVDLVVGSDVLYSEGAVGPLARLLAFLLVGDGDEGGTAGADDDGVEAEDVMRRALLVDPANRLHRDAFAERCRGCGLSVETVPFPGGGGDDFVLISVTPE